MQVWANKDPSDVLDYTIDYSALLDGDTIASSVWSVDAGITIDSDTNTTTNATVWVSGGTSGNVYTFTNTITTAGGRTFERSARLTVKNL